MDIIKITFTLLLFVLNTVQEVPVNQEVVDVVTPTVVETLETHTPIPFEEEVEWLKPCATSNVKSYMDYRAITNTQSKQYQYIQKHITIKEGLLYEGEYIGVALGSWWGNIGAKWVIELDTGIQLKVVKLDEKADRHVINGCQHKKDTSVIEFVVDSNSVPSSWWGNNGLILNGNFNNSELFKGSIKKISRGG